MSTTMTKTDSPTERISILDMSDADLEAYTSDLQEKRMLTHKRYEEAETARKKVRDEKTRAQMETLLRQMAKSMAAIDKHAETFQKKYGQVMTMKRIAEMEGEADA